jgi:hypothetical protein
VYYRKKGITLCVVRPCVGARTFGPARASFVWSLQPLKGLEPPTGLVQGPRDDRAVDKQLLGSTWQVRLKAITFCTLDACICCVRFLLEPSYICSDWNKHSGKLPSPYFLEMSMMKASFWGCSNCLIRRAHRVLTGHHGRHRCPTESTVLVWVVCMVDLSKLKENPVVLRNVLACKYFVSTAAQYFEMKGAIPLD